MIRVDDRPLAAYSSGGQKLLRIVVVRDPKGKGRKRDDCFCKIAG